MQVISKPWDHLAHQAAIGDIIPAPLNLPAMPQSQAERLANYRLTRAIDLNETISLRAGPDAAALTPGDVIDLVVDEDIWAGAETYEIEEITDEPTLQREITARLYRDAAYSDAAGASQNLLATTIQKYWGPGASYGDNGVPSEPTFGIFTARDGKLLFGPPGFGTLDNTHSISSGRAFIRYADEIAGAKTTLAADIDDTTETVTVASSAGFSEDDHAVLDQECVLIRVIAGTTWTVTRHELGSPPAAHSAGANTYDLAARLVTFAFSPGFFGSGPDAQWEAVIDLPCARIASVQLWVTNVFGDAPVATNNYLIYQMEPDAPYGYRTNRGGDFVLGIDGLVYISIDPGEDVWVDAAVSVRDVFAFIDGPPTGAAMVINVRRNGATWATLTIAADETLSDAVSGASLPALAAGDLLNFEIVSVGSTFPGFKLTIMVRT
jgi:hypothetical protein